MSHFKIVSSLRQLYLIRDQCWTNPATFVDASLSWVLWLKRFPARRTLEIVAALLCSLWSPSWPVTMSISNCSPSMLSAWLLPSPSPEARSKNLYDSRQRHKTFYYKRSDFKQRVCVCLFTCQSWGQVLVSAEEDQPCKNPQLWTSHHSFQLHILQSHYLREKRCHDMQDTLL